MLDFILASGSQVRLKLLRQIGVEPKAIKPADIDETPLKKEKPIFGRGISSMPKGFYHKACQTNPRGGREIFPVIF